MRQCLKVEVYNHAYVRVSTEKQTVENQKLVIKEFCKCHRIIKLNWISETFSGTKNPEKRKLGELINLVNDGDVVVIIEAAMLRNGCRTKAELIAIYSLEERLPELFPSLFPENQDSIP